MATTEASSEALPTIYDVIIIGAGPCGLAVAARLREHTPSALFTDAEHNRYHWIKRHAGQASIKHSKTGRLRTAQQQSHCNESSPSMLVLDSSGDSWMTKWNRLFAELEISHLRSPMFFHPDPYDRDGLLAYAHAEGRECECLEIAGCVGKEISKHRLKKRRKQRQGQDAARPPITIDERDRKDYFAPPSDLFRDYCGWIARRYGLCDSGLIQLASVQDIDYGHVPKIDSNKNFFTVTTNQGTRFARSVVLAVGAGNGLSIPRPFPQKDCPCSCHALQSVDETLPWRKATRRINNVLVVGGGLTSAQVSDRAIRNGATKVWHLMRGPMKVKPFDVDLRWMSKFKNHEKATFWSADTDEERSELIKVARGGGSITPRFAKTLQQHVSSGKLCIQTHTVIIGQQYDPSDETWTIEAEPPIPDLPRFHHIYFATGVQSDIDRLSYMQTMHEKYPIETFDGLPALTDDLMWRADIPLFMTGRFAALRLGPGAGNLEGARTGAERIAWALGDVLHDEASRVRESHGETKTDTFSESGEYRYRVGLGSRFEALSTAG